MKNFILALLFLQAGIMPLNVKAGNVVSNPIVRIVQYPSASITFKNNSGYDMVLKIMYPKGGLYSSVYLDAYSSRTVSFSETSSYRLKIKATKGRSVSYHDGGSFSITCTQYEYTQGEMTFQMSSYGSGLGPTISEKEFESNY